MNRRNLFRILGAAVGICAKPNPAAGVKHILWNHNHRATFVSTSNFQEIYARQVLTPFADRMLAKYGHIGNVSVNLPGASFTLEDAATDKPLAVGDRIDASSKIQIRFRGQEWT